MNTSDIEQIVGGKPAVVQLGELLARAQCSKRATWLDIPSSPGIYAVSLPDWKTLTFVSDAGSARHAESTDPNVLRDKRDRILAAGPKSSERDRILASPRITQRVIDIIVPRSPMFL